MKYMKHLFKLALGLLAITVSTTLRGQIAVQEVTYKQVDTVRLKMKLYYPADYSSGKRYPAIVFFFGGGWMTGNIDQFKPQAEYLASKGMIAATAEYRIGKKHGTTPFESVKDGRSAIRYLRKNAEHLGIDTGRLAAGGGSAGGHVAAAADLTAIDEETDDLSVNPRPNALVLFNPVFNNGPGNYGYDRLKNRYREISPFHNIRQGAAPTVVLLGTKDKLIPVAMAKQYQQNMQEVGGRCDLILYEGQEHGFFNYRPQKGLRYFRETLLAAEEFLTDLGYIVN